MSIGPFELLILAVVVLMLASVGVVMAVVLVRSLARRTGRTLRPCPECGQGTARRARKCHKCGAVLPEKRAETTR